MPKLIQKRMHNVYKYKFYLIRNVTCKWFISLWITVNVNYLWFILSGILFLYIMCVFLWRFKNCDWMLHCWTATILPVHHVCRQICGKLHNRASFKWQTPTPIPGKCYIIIHHKTHCSLMHILHLSILLACFRNLKAMVPTQGVGNVMASGYRPKQMCSRRCKDVESKGLTLFFI